MISIARYQAVTESASGVEQGVTAARQGCNPPNVWTRRRPLLGGQTRLLHRAWPGVQVAKPYRAGQHSRPDITTTGRGAIPLAVGFKRGVPLCLVGGLRGWGVRRRRFSSSSD